MKVILFSITKTFCLLKYSCPEYYTTK